MMKRAASVLLAVLMLVSVLPLQTLAADSADFPEVDRPMIENQTDSSRLPAR